MEIAEKDLRVLYVALRHVYEGVISVSVYICCGSGYGIRCVLRINLIVVASL